MKLNLQYVARTPGGNEHRQFTHYEHGVKPNVLDGIKLDHLMVSGTIQTAREMAEISRFLDIARRGLPHRPPAQIIPGHASVIEAPAIDAYTTEVWFIGMLYDADSAKVLIDQLGKAFGYDPQPQAR